MYEELAAHHRLVTVAYQRFLEADMALALALEAMRQVFPADQMPHRGTLGTPRSRIRHLREQRDQALLRFQSSMAKLRAAKARAELRRRRARQVRLLTVILD